MRLLTVCTANRCRSPMAAGLLVRRLGNQGVEATVGSAGFGPPDQPAVDEAVDVMADVGVDLGDHRSRLLDAELLAGADVVIVMTRQHAIDVVLTDAGAWPRTFPFVDLVRRAQRVGPVRHGDSPAGWVARVHAGRQRRDLLALGRSDDIADPLGQSLDAFRRTRDRLDQLSEELVALLAPARPPG